jgi:hypothetical protein
LRTILKRKTLKITFFSKARRSFHCWIENTRDKVGRRILLGDNTGGGGGGGGGAVIPQPITLGCVAFCMSAGLLCIDKCT